MELSPALKKVCGLTVAAALLVLLPAASAFVGSPVSAAVTTAPTSTARNTESGLYGVRWDPCRPISVRVLPHGGYAGSAREIRKAFRVAGKVTGIRFVQVGAQTADVTVRWSTPARFPLLAGPIAGRTTTTIVVHDGVMENTRGRIVLDRTERLRHGFAASGPSTWGQVYLHELGHLLGLDHVSQPSQVMYPAIGRANHRYGAGDLRRLREVGRAAGCVPGSRR